MRPPIQELVRYAAEIRTEQLTEWECNFVAHVSAALKTGVELNDLQIAKLTEIWLRSNSQPGAGAT